MVRCVLEANVYGVKVEGERLEQEAKSPAAPPSPLLTPFSPPARPRGPGRHGSARFEGRGRVRLFGRLPAGRQPPAVVRETSIHQDSGETITSRSLPVA